ncbi:MAG: M24 family metallopeptidase, partial [Alphaproteobacteria bacterium]
MNADDKLKMVREAMQLAGVQGFIQPLHDEFISEYPPACARRLQWLCGFSGSAGSLVVLRDKAALFTDGRYTLQAANEVDGALFESYNSADLTSAAWTAQQAPAMIGYDARLFTPAMLKHYEKASEGKVQFMPIANPIDAVWNDRPAQPATPLFVHDMAYAGQSAKEKRAQLCEFIARKQGDAMLLSAPDSICWLLNIRASDVEHSPLLLASLLVERDGPATLFVDPARCDAAVRQHLGDSLTLAHPDDMERTLAAFAKGKPTVLADPAQVTLWFAQAMQGAQFIDCPDPCQKWKAVKNMVELAGIRTAHIRDGVAIVKLLHWLDSEVATRAITELNVCDRLRSFRAESPHFHDLSFPTISGSGPHGAIVHYRADENSNRVLGEGELFLLDSGAQYPDGTTDITRTIPIGKPTGEMCDRFTRVLKGHIALATARFPKGTSGSQLDTLARQYLWQAGVDYDHGTGHGVGCFLSVHEGPQRISKRGGDVALEPGMIISNEPGYYKTGAYGIRIENLVVVVESGDGAGGKPFYGFDTVTCAPIDTR